MGCGCSKGGAVLEAAGTRSPAGARNSPQSQADKAEVLRVLSSFDEPLVEALRRGDICLVRSSWVLKPYVGGRPSRIRRRQDLEEMARSGVSPTPLLDATEATALLSRADRSVGALSYGWLSPGAPDPAGRRLDVVRQTLAAHPRIEGLFWDYASLPQLPRTADEENAFGRALEVMADLFASAVGTTVLQIREVPPRPKEFDGALCLFNLRAAAVGATSMAPPRDASSWACPVCTRSEPRTLTSICRAYTRTQRGRA